MAESKDSTFSPGPTQQDLDRFKIGTPQADIDRFNITDISKPPDIRMLAANLLSRF